MIEMVVVLAIIGTLAVILTPIVTNYVDQSRVAKAQSDARTIGEAISHFEKDMGRYPMWATSNALLQDSTANVVTLRSPGNLPAEAVTTAWTSAMPTDSDCASGCQFDDLQDQLLTNAPLYATTTSLAKPFKWKGPYLDSTADPWGNMYLVNIINCKSTSSDACFVISAGPNGKIETAFNISKSSSVSPTNDDILYRIK
jgi:type II secretory pathway pseudopilin PulG